MYWKGPNNIACLVTFTRKCIYARAIYKHELLRDTQSRYQPISLMRGCHLIQKHSTCLNRFLALFCVGVSNENLYRAYLHQQWNVIPKTCRALLTSIKLAMVKHQQTCICSRWGTSAYIQYQLLHLGKIGRKVEYPFHCLLPFFSSIFFSSSLSTSWGVVPPD